MIEIHWILFAVSYMLSALALIGIMACLFCFFMYDEYEEHRKTLKQIWAFLQQPAINSHKESKDRMDE